MARRIRFGRCAAGVVAALVVAGSLDAQTGAHRVHSLGQPDLWQLHGGVFAIGEHSVDGVGAGALVGVHRPFMNPVVGVLGVSGEGYWSFGNHWKGMGLRAMAGAPVLALSAGLDVTFAQGRAAHLAPVFSYRSGVRRAGILGHGTMVRLDWLPTRGQSFTAGLHIPLGRANLGVTRPLATVAMLPKPSSLDFPGTVTPEADRALTRVTRTAELIRIYTAALTKEDARKLSASAADAPYDSVIREYHEQLEEAFSGGSASAGKWIANRARAGLLSHVIIPFDSLFGQYRYPRDDIRGLLIKAQESFKRWATDSSGLSPDDVAVASAVHSRWLGIVDDVHQRLVGRWRDSRIVWLPLQLALKPEQYDEQLEIDRIIERLVGRPFSDENVLSYLRSSDLPLEIARSIYAARDYHVLWVHDFTGRREGTKSVDNMGYEMVADVYLPALTAAVRRYDEAGTLPIYMIVLDQFWYEPRDGRLWMSILEDPLRASMSLPGGNLEREQHLRSRQAELRNAVAASERLQREAAAQGGMRWLSDVIKVHVNVTHPSDFSFRSHYSVPPIMFTPDNVMRDHRKLVLYDLNEAEPYRGGMFIMGVVVGEHYASATLEDRGVRLRGPAALEARVALRRLLARNGFTESEIPLPLREVRDARQVERQMQLGDNTGRVLQMHNEVGFGAKASSVVRAALYELTAPGGIIIVPDPIWASDEWAAMLAAAAARGAKVQIIAPALANAPSPQEALMALVHDVLARLLERRLDLAGALRASGGDLRIGLFAARSQVDDIAGRRQEIREGLRRNPWIRNLFPFDDQTLAVLDRAEASTADGADATESAKDEKPRPPQLHQKTQLFARPDAITLLARQPGWDDALLRAMRLQSGQTARFAEQVEWTTPAVEEESAREVDAILRSYEDALPEAQRDRVSFYLTVGTQNQDPRGLAIDGEATLVSSGIQGVAGLVDLFYLMARTTWVETPAELNRLLPEPSGFMRWLSQLIRPAL
jgi:hypothetical protein